MKKQQTKTVIIKVELPITDLERIAMKYAKQELKNSLYWLNRKLKEVRELQQFVKDSKEAQEALNTKIMLHKRIKRLEKRLKMQLSRYSYNEDMLKV